MGIASPWCHLSWRPRGYLGLSPDRRPVDGRCRAHTRRARWSRCDSGRGTRPVGHATASGRRSEPIQGEVGDRVRKHSERSIVVLEIPDTRTAHRASVAAVSSVTNERSVAPARSKTIAVPSRASTRTAPLPSHVSSARAPESSSGSLVTFNNAGCPLTVTGRTTDDRDGSGAPSNWRPSRTMASSSSTVDGFGMSGTAQ